MFAFDCTDLFSITKPSTALEGPALITDATVFTIQTETIEISQTEENKAQIDFITGIHTTQRCLFFKEMIDGISTLLSNQSYDTANYFPAMRGQSIFTGRSRYIGPYQPYQPRNVGSFGLGNSLFLTIA